MKALLLIAATSFSMTVAINANAETPASTTAATESAKPVAGAEAGHAQHKDHSHKHGAKCGHKSAKHGDHEDYAHDGHQHKAHGDHTDECATEKTAAK